MERSAEEIAEDKDIIGEVNELGHVLFTHLFPHAGTACSKVVLPPDDALLYRNDASPEETDAFNAAKAAYQHLNPGEDVDEILDRLEDDAQGDPEPDIHRAYKDSTLGL